MYDGGTKYLVLYIRMPLSIELGLCRFLDLTFEEFQLHALCE
jgi:hypothetical protein